MATSSDIVETKVSDGYNRVRLPNGKFEKFSNFTYSITSHVKVLETDARKYILDCSTIEEIPQTFRILLDRADGNNPKSILKVINTQTPEHVSITLYDKAVTGGKVHQHITAQMDNYDKPGTLKTQFLLANAPRYYKDQDTELTYFILQGGQVIPASIKVSERISYAQFAFFPILYIYPILE